MRFAVFFKKLFDHRLAGSFCVSFAILNKSVVAWLFSSLEGDKSLYLLFTQSFLQTGVMADPVNVFENGRFVYLYDPAVHSPLYSLVCAPVLWLTHSFFVTQFAASVASFALLFTGLLQAARLVLSERWQAPLFVLCAGFFLYPFELASLVKDFFAVGFSLWCVVLLHRFFNGKPAWIPTVLLALSIGCLCLTKMLYVALGTLLVAVLLAGTAKKQSKTHFLHAAVCLALLLVMGAATKALIFHPAEKLATAQTIRLPADGASFQSGFFPENFLLAQPFLTAAVVNVNFWGVQLERRAHLPYLQTVKIFQCADAVLLVTLLVTELLFFRRLWQKKALGLFLLPGVFMIAVVFFLSLTQKAFSFKSDTSPWTYVTDVRSFFLPMLCLQVLLFRFIFNSHKALLLRKALLLLFLFECLHGLYFTAKEGIAQNLAPRANKSISSIETITRSLLQQSGSNKRLLVTSDRYLRRYAQVNLLPVYSFTNEPANLSWIKKGERFLVATHRMDSSSLDVFPEGSLLAKDTIEPFVIHVYQHAVKNE